MNENESLKELLHKFENEFEKVCDKLLILENDKKLYVQGYRDGIFEAFSCVADKIDGTKHTKSPYINKILNE